MLAYKTFFLAVAGVLTVCLGMLAVVVHAPAVWPIGAAIVFGAFAIRAAQHVVHGAEYFQTWRQEIKRKAIGWIIVATIAHVLAVIVLELIGVRWSIAWITAVAALVVTEIGVAHGLELLWFRLKPLPSKINSSAPGTDLELRPAGAIESDQAGVVVSGPRIWSRLSHDEQIMKIVLEESGLDWVEMISYEPILDGDRMFGAMFTVRVPVSRLISEGAEKAKIPASAAEPIAIALGAKLDVPLESRFVSIRKQPAAGVYVITVVTEDVMARLYVYRDPNERKSFKAPALCGYGIDTRPIHLRLDQHGQHIGKSRAGKSSLIHVLLGYMTLCAGNGDNRDCIVIVAGTEKVYDLVGSWIEPYLGTDEPLPFGLIARGPEDTLSALIMLMTIARYRQSVPMHLRNWPSIVLILDEASFALRNKAVVGEWDGQEVTMSDVAGMIGQGAGSGDCFVHYATQRDTNDQLGDKGGDLSAQTGFTTLFRIKDNASVGRLMGDYLLPMPKNAGECWLDDGDHDPQLNKAPYIQEVDPTKKRLHEGATLSDIAWARRRFPRELDAGSAQAAGEFWANRYTRATPALMAYVSGSTLVSEAGPTMAGSYATTAQPGAPVTKPRREKLSPDTVIAMARAAGVLSEQEAAALSRSQRVGFAEAIQDQVGTIEEFARLLADRGNYVPTAPANEAPEDTAPQDAVPAGHSLAAPAPAGTRRELITRILDEAGQPLTSAQIIEALRAANDAVPSLEAVYNELKRMVDRDKLMKSDAGLYALPGWAIDMLDSVDATTSDAA